MGGQVNTRVASLHDGLHRPSLTSHTLEPAPTTAECHTGAASPTSGWAYTAGGKQGAQETTHVP